MSMSSLDGINTSKNQCATLPFALPLP